MRKLAALPVLLLLLTGCYHSTDTQEVAVHQHGSVMFPTDQDLAGDCMRPGQTKALGVGDKGLDYPAGQRSYKFGTGRGQDMPGVHVITKDGAQMTMTGVVTFYLNTDCDVLRRFHTQIGSKDWDGQPAYVNDGYQGWDAMLDVYIGQQLRNVVNDAAGGQDSSALYKDPTIRRELQGPIGAELPKAVRDFAHGPYFRDFTVELNQPQAPAALVKAYNDRVAAVQENRAQAARNTTALTQLDQLKACKRAGMAESTCAFIYAVNTGRVTAIPQGSAVTLP
jgi:hypothetical protein